MQDHSGKFGFGFGSAVSIFTVLVVCGGMYGCPQYNVYSSRLSGQAKLAESESERMAQINDAKGKLESAKLLAEAEVERAKGAAQSNDVLMEKLGGPEGYLRYLYIQQLEHRTGDTIYVPTEAGLSILEASRFQRSNGASK